MTLAFKTGNTENIHRLIFQHQSIFFNSINLNKLQ